MYIFPPLIEKRKKKAGKIGKKKKEKKMNLIRQSF